MSFTVGQTPPTALSTRITSHQEPHPCIPTSDILPQLANLSAFLDLQYKHGVENVTVTIPESVEAGGSENASLDTIEYFGRGHRDCDGDCFGGRGCNLIAGNSTEGGCETAGLKHRARARSTKTTTAPFAHETIRIVNIGLAVAFLGLLSVLC